MSKLLNVSFGIGMQFFLKIALGVILLKLIANNFGPEGLYAIANVQNVQQIIQAVIFSFLSTGVVTYAAKNPDDTLIKNTAIQLLQRALLISILILVALIAANIEKIYILYLTMIVGTFFSGIYAYNQSIANSKEKYLEYNNISILFTVIIGVASIISVFALELKFAIIILAILPMIAAILVEIIFRKNNINYIKLKDLFYLLQKKINWKILAYLSKYAWSSAIIVCISYGMQYFFRNQLANEVSAVVAGQWTASYKLSELYMGIVNLIISVLILPLASKDTASSKKIIWSYVKPIMLIITTALLVYIALADFITNNVLGSSFAGTAYLIRIQTLPDIIKISTWFFAFFMMAKGFLKLYLIIEVTGYLIATIFGYVFITYYGSVGITYGLTAQAVFLMFAYLVWFIKLKQND